MYARRRSRAEAESTTRRTTVGRGGIATAPYGVLAGGTDPQQRRRQKRRRRRGGRHRQCRGRKAKNETKLITF